MTHVIAPSAGPPQKNQSKKTSILLTRFTSDTGPLAKKISYQDGEFHKEAAAALSSGIAETLDLPGLHRLIDIIEGLEQNQALATGIFDIPKCRIITENKLTPDLYAQGYRARSKKFMRQPTSGLLLFDYDEGPHTPGHLLCSSPEELMHKPAVIPELDGLMYCGLPSSSAGISHRPSGKTLNSGGLHVYLPMENVDLDQFRKWLEVRLWQAGLGYIAYARNGAALVRYIVDLAVLSPERLIFEAPPLLGPGLVQAERKFDLQPGRVLGDE